MTRYILQLQKQRLDCRYGLPRASQVPSSNIYSACKCILEIDEIEAYSRVARGSVYCHYFHSDGSHKEFGRATFDY
jgi:hypothetical protein